MERTGVQREYVLLEERDENYRRSIEKAAGFVKIEDKGQSTEIVCRIQGVRSGSNLTYGLYLIHGKDTNAGPLKVGDIHITGERGEATCRFAENGIKQGIEDFQAFAVIVEETDDEGGIRAACPLAGFKKGVHDAEGKISRLLEQLKGDSSVSESPEVKNGMEPESREGVPEYGFNGAAEHGVSENAENMGYSCDQCARYQVMTEDTEQTKSCDEGIDVIENLKGSFSKYFQEYEPFERRNDLYKWWKAASLAHLNNILYANNIRTVLLHSPIVMMSHYKYRYVIVGIYRSRKQNEYIVCGIPSTYGVDRRPFGELSRWIPVRYKRPTPGDFGYWVVYIDPRTGEFVS